MKFAIIGLDAVNTFSRKIEKSLKKLGHKVYFLSTDEIKNRYCVSVFKKDYHLARKYPIDLREILPVDMYDMIIISHNDFVFNNPRIGSTKVLYYHREMLCYPSCFNPDILADNIPKHDKFIWHYYPKLWYSTSIRIPLHLAVDPEEFDPNREKDLKGLNYVSVHEDVVEEKRDIFWNYLHKNYNEREKLFTSNGCRVNGNKYVKYEEYKDYIERSEAFLNFTSPGIFGSRRIMEIAACKSLPVLHVESEESEEYHNDLGFVDTVNCIMFKNNPKLYELEPFPNDLIKKAYNMVLSKHTYDHRAKEILEILT